MLRLRGDVNHVAADSVAEAHRHVVASRELRESIPARLQFLPIARAAWETGEIDLEIGIGHTMLIRPFIFCVSGIKNSLYKQMLQHA